MKFNPVPDGSIRGAGASFPPVGIGRYGTRWKRDLGHNRNIQGVIDKRP